MSNLDQIFAPIDAIKEPEVKKVLEYNPSAKNSKTGVYQGCIRFIPWHMDPNKSIMQKTQVFLTDPLTQRGRYIDSPRSVNEQCVITDTFWSLYNSDNAVLKDFAKKHINISTTYTALVQIVADDQHPELVGKILPWRFKKTIWEKLYNESHPQMGIAYNPFDIINGRYFSIKVVLKNGWNNYDNCGFFDYRGNNGETSGMLMMNESNRFEIVTPNTDRQRVYDYLVQNSPNLNDYDYKPWTTDDANYVNSVIQTITQYAQTGTYGQNVAVATAPQVNQQVSMPNMSVPSMQPIPTTPYSQPAVPTMSMPNGPVMEANVQSVPPVASPIMGIDLPQMNNESIPQMNATPQNSGMNLADLYGGL